MTDPLDWADDVLDEEARLSEHLTDAELADRILLNNSHLYMEPLHGRS